MASLPRPVGSGVTREIQVPPQLLEKFKQKYSCTSPFLEEISAKNVVVLPQRLDLTDRASPIQNSQLRPCYFLLVVENERSSSRK